MGRISCLRKLTKNIRKQLRCLSWFKLDRAKLRKPKAEFWVFVLHSFKKRKPDFVVIPGGALQRIARLHRSPGAIHTYLCSTESDRCWEVRDRKSEHLLGRIADGVYRNKARDFTRYLNDWSVVVGKLRGLA